MAQNTALQELKQWVDDNYPNFNKADIEAKIDELIPKERQDIIDAYNEGYREGEIDGVDNGRKLPLDVSEYNNADNYFTQTYNQK